LVQATARPYFQLTFSATLW